MDENEIELYKKAGNIAKEVREFAKNYVKKDMFLVEIAQKIENKIYELNAEPAFPVNLSINEVAAHYHPIPNEETKAEGLLKIDIGVHIKGLIADTAISIDLTNEKKYRKLIEAVDVALNNALNILKNDPSLHVIGSIIQKIIEDNGFSPIINLSGHSIEKFNIHAGVTIPNYGNNNLNKLSDGVYAIEPFATTGAGSVYEGNAGNIYSIQNLKNARSDYARKILSYIYEKHKTLPFSLREIHEKFGQIAKLSLIELEKQGIIKSYHQLIEKSKKPVAQAEHTFIKLGNNIIITTL